LYLNVYSTQDGNSSETKNASLKPVLVYIHGGSLVAGSGTTNFTNFMLNACTRGCTVVTIQYRLDLLGWLASQDLSSEQGGSSGNYGLMDQQRALSWIQENIESFGGDKTRVTVAGQSSGGTSIIALMASSHSKGLFHRAISLSGSPNITMNLERAHRQNSNISTPECRGLATGESRLACLRNASIPALLHARPDCWITPVQGLIPTSKAGWSQRGAECGLPVVDGKVIEDATLPSLSQGKIDIPIIIGNMGWEDGEDGDFPSWSVKTSREWASFIEEAFRQRIRA